MPCAKSSAWPQMPPPLKTPGNALPAREERRADTLHCPRRGSRLSMSVSAASERSDREVEPPGSRCLSTEVSCFCASEISLNLTANPLACLCVNRCLIKQ